jgi:hypothetical protein
MELSIITVEVNQGNAYIGRYNSKITPVVRSTSEQRMILIGDAQPTLIGSPPGLHNFFLSITIVYCL